MKMENEYMETLVSQLGIERVLEDLRSVVSKLAEDTDTDDATSRSLFLLEQDLGMAIGELTDDA